MSAYSAAQIAMVMVLEPRGRMEHLKPNCRAKMIEYDLKEGTPDEVSYPESNLNSFIYLFKCCQPTLRPRFPDSLEKDVENLSKLRDKWTHFGIYDYYVPVSEARRAVKAAMTLLEYLDLPPTDLLFNDPREQALYDSSREAIAKLVAVEAFDHVPKQPRREKAYEAMLSRFPG